MSCYGYINSQIKFQKHTRRSKDRTVTMQANPRNPSKSVQVCSCIVAHLHPFGLSRHGGHSSTREESQRPRQKRSAASTTLNTSKLREPQQTPQNMFSSATHTLKIICMSSCIAKLTHALTHARQDFLWPPAMALAQTCVTRISRDSLFAQTRV